MRLCWNDPDEPIRFAALRSPSFGRFDGMREHLNDESARCRVQAARWLLWSADDRDAAGDLLLKEFGTEPTEVQQLVIKTFSEQGKNQYRTLGHVRDLLLRRSVSNDPAVRDAARRALLLVPETKKVTAIQAALDEEFAALRKSRDQGQMTEAQAIQTASKQVDDWLSHNNPTDEDRARINHHVAHAFARWNLDLNVSLVRQYAAASLNLDVNPARRVSLHALLGSAALADRPRNRSWSNAEPPRNTG